jgi:hypothetical protein
MTILLCRRFDITPKGQQVHIALGPKEFESPRHPCFLLESAEDLARLQQKIWEHHQRGDASAPRTADKPGGENSGKTLPLFDFRSLPRYERVLKAFGLMI